MTKIRIETNKQENTRKNKKTQNTKIQAMKKPFKVKALMP